MRLTGRMASMGMKADAVMMDVLRKSNAAEHARRSKPLQVAQAAQRRAEALAQAQEEAQKQAMKIPAASIRP